MLDVIYLTREGFEKKKRELDHLVKVRRPQVLERIKQCQDRSDREEEGGDTEFQEAKREQAWVETRIEELRKVLAVSELLQPDQIPLERVGLGSVVHLQDLDTRQKRLCQIVSALEADPAANKISAESPVGTALLDKTPGETVEVKTPAGVRRYRILKLATEFPVPSGKRPVVRQAHGSTLLTVPSPSRDHPEQGRGAVATKPKDKPAPTPRKRQRPGSPHPSGEVAAPTKEKKARK